MMPKTNFNRTKVTLRLDPTDWEKLKCQANQRGFLLQDHLRSVIHNLVKDVRLPGAGTSPSESVGLFEPAEIAKWKQMVKDNGGDFSELIRKIMRCYEQRNCA